MINIHDYFSVDWDATADNLRSFVEGYIKPKTLAEAMCVTERTIYNWCHNKAHPNLEDLILLAKFFDVDVLDLIVTNGQTKKPISQDDVKEALENAKTSCKQNNNDAIRPMEESYECVTKEDFISAVLFHEYKKQSYPITTLEEFLLYLPLFSLDDLHNCLNRIQDNLADNWDYVLKQLQRMYDRIEHINAKQYAEWYQNYFFRYPRINRMYGDILRKDKRAKYDNLQRELPQFFTLSQDYDEQYEKMVSALRSLAFSEAEKEVQVHDPI